MIKGYKVADITLAEKGREGLYVAGRKMPVTASIIRDEFKKTKPLKGIRIGACLHVTKETGNLARTLIAGGAEVYICGSNPLSTQDDAAAAMVEDGVHVYAWHGNTNEEYYWCVRQVLDANPHILIDDGADLIVSAHKEYPELIKNGIIACQEETTTGVKRFVAMDAAGDLKVPLFPVNDARCKNEFDNELGTGQGIVSAIYGMHILFAGKTVVIAGYGHCSSGMALRARGLGAKVIITEVDPIAALKATYAGYPVMKMDNAIGQADVVFTATGCNDVVTKKHFDRLKDGCILGNLGHFNVEIAVEKLYEYCIDRKNIRKDVEELTLPNRNKVYLLGQGRLANLVLSEGHPAEVMDQSFALQSLVSKYIVENRGKFKPGMIKVPEFIDNQVGFLKLKTMGIEIDEWTEEQRRYTQGYMDGT